MVIRSNTVRLTQKFTLYFSPQHIEFWHLIDNILQKNIWVAISQTVPSDMCTNNLCSQIRIFTGHTLGKHIYSNTCILKILPPKTVSFQIKCWYFSYFCSKHRFWVFVRTTSVSRSNKYPQFMFLSRNKKNNVYPCKPQFYYIKVGFKGGQNYIRTFSWCYKICAVRSQSSLGTSWIAKNAKFLQVDNKDFHQTARIWVFIDCTCQKVCLVML